jgi:hypothetical protein
MNPPAGSWIGSGTKVVVPKVVGENVFCTCGSLMFPVAYDKIDGHPSRWMYWSCHRDGGHLTCAIPIPKELMA